MLTPVKKWCGIPALMARILHGSGLKRLKPARSNGYLRLRVITDKGALVSTGLVGSLIQGSCPAAIDDAIALKARNYKTGVALGMVTQLVPDKNAATMIYDYHKQLYPDVHDEVFTGASFVRSYQFEPEEYDPDAKPSLTAFMEPIVDGAFAPSMTMANAKKGVEGRIEKVKSKVNLTRTNTRLVHEFVAEIVADPVNFGLAGSVIPIELDEVYESLEKRSQKNIFEMAVWLMSSVWNKVCDVMLKREAYGKCSDPRLITQIPGPDKITYACYLKALKHGLVNLHWYGSAKTPEDIAHRVVEICLKAQFGSQSDVSRMDGSINELLRYVDVCFAMAFLKDEYKTSFKEIYNKNHNRKCAVRVGEQSYAYDPELAQLSGAMDTTDFNTLRMAYCVFVAYRSMRGKHGETMSPREAYNKIGVVSGDDTYNVDIPAKVFTLAGKRCGLSLEVEIIPRGLGGVKFLNRVFGPEVWFGDAVSHGDIKRALSKFHTCVGLPDNITRERKLFDKAYAYWLMDKNTPILGEFVSRVVELAAGKYDFVNFNNVWFAKYGENSQFPNDYRDWMEVDVEQQLPDFDLIKFRKWLYKCTKLSDLLSPPPCMDPLPVITSSPVVVDGIVHMPVVKRVAPKNTKTPAHKGEQIARK